MENLKYYRERACLSQQQLADALGVSRAAVSLWETGKGWPRASLLIHMADLLLCSIDELCGRESYFKPIVLRGGSSSAIISIDERGEN